MNLAIIPVRGVSKKITRKHTIPLLARPCSLVQSGVYLAGIGVNSQHMPVYSQHYCWALKFKEGMFPEAQCDGQNAISLSMYPNLTLDQQ